MQGLQNTQNFQVQTIVKTTTVEAPSSPMAWLTPDALMTYCATRLRDLDGQIRFEMTKQQSTQEENATLSKLLKDLNADVSTDVDLTSSAGVAQINKAKAHLASVADQLRATDPATAAMLDELGKKLDSMANANTAGKDGTAFDHGMSVSSFKSAITDSIANVQKDLNSGTELAMINLQSLMSLRQSAVQVVTNMVQALGDQLNKVAANIGH